MSDDARGWRIALVPDTLINAPARASPASPDVLGVLEQSGYGVLQLPPPGEHRRLLDSALERDWRAAQKILTTHVQDCVAQMIDGGLIA